MIELKSKEGVTDIHAEGTRLDLAADAACVSYSMICAFAQYTGMPTARALMFLTQQHLQQLAKEGDTE